MKGLQINHCMYIRDLLCKGSRGFKQTYLLATVQKKFCLKCPLGERGGDRAHTAGDKQSKAELGSNESPTLRLCTRLRYGRGRDLEGEMSPLFRREVSGTERSLLLFWVTTGLSVDACGVTGFGKHQEPVCNGVNSETCVRHTHNSSHFSI